MTDGIKLLLSEPDSTTESERKHMVLLSLIYGTASRVQESVDVNVEDLAYNGHNLLRLTGKGNKRLTVIELQITFEHFELSLVEDCSFPVLELLVYSV